MARLPGIRLQGGVIWCFIWGGYWRFNLNLAGSFKVIQSSMCVLFDICSRVVDLHSIWVSYTGMDVYIG